MQNISINNILGWKSIIVSVLCVAGKKEYNIGYQEYLKEKCIKAIYQTGNSVGRDNEPIATTNFWIDLKQGLDTLLSLSANFLNWSQNGSVIEINLDAVDFQNSKIVFPTVLLADTTIELIVFYKDTVENPN